jgi:hypothetical protein
MVASISPRHVPRKLQRHQAFKVTLLCRFFLLRLLPKTLQMRGRGGGLLLLTR